MSNTISAAITAGETSLGIEFGSTRVKAVLIGADLQPVATGGHEWASRLEDGYWTYDLKDAWSGLQKAYADLVSDVKSRYGVTLERVGSLGFSALMHSTSSRSCWCRSGPTKTRRPPKPRVN